MFVLLGTLAGVLTASSLVATPSPWRAFQRKVLWLVMTWVTSAQ